jgi:hypothetical protein
VCDGRRESWWGNALAVGECVGGWSVRPIGIRIMSA